MGRAEWICNMCGKGFSSKGRRDGHRESDHRKEVVIRLSDQEPLQVGRSENGKFKCKCGREYTYAQCLKRHRIKCTASILMIENESENSEDEEGTRQFMYEFMEFANDRTRQ
jgi:hypothetical protein